MITTMIVEMVPMKEKNVIHNIKLVALRNFHARTLSALESNIGVMEKMIVVITLMKSIAVSDHYTLL